MAQPYGPTMNTTVKTQLYHWTSDRYIWTNLVKIHTGFDTSCCSWKNMISDCWCSLTTLFSAGDGGIAGKRGGYEMDADGFYGDTFSGWASTLLCFSHILKKPLCTKTNTPSLLPIFRKIGHSIFILITTTLPILILTRHNIWYKNFFLGALDRSTQWRKGESLTQCCGGGGNVFTRKGK